jgi:NAD(P)-dependent dehydrogenase (short-subunit alcohol dehydrogenase family)
MEYATRGIRVNDVCPGMIRTPMSDKMIAEGQGEELDAMLQAPCADEADGAARGDRRRCPVALQ